MTEIVQSKSINNHRISFTLHEAAGKNIVIFCHGFRGTNTGPNRFFVRAARQLEAAGISSLRFDQFGSGNSEGDFLDSSFYDWVETTRIIAEQYMEQGYRVALFGQSMGGAAAIVAAARALMISSVVAWAPSVILDDHIAPPDSIVEESGQIVKARFWQEAHTARIADKLSDIKAPVYIVQCTADEYVDQRNRDALTKKARPNHIVENFEGYVHSNWTYAQSKEIIDKSISFLVKSFPQAEKTPPALAVVTRPSIAPSTQAPSQPSAKQISAEEKAELDRKIKQILEEEGAFKKKPNKPPFSHGKHLMYVATTAGLWLPVWLVLYYKWKKSEGADEA